MVAVLLKIGISPSKFINFNQIEWNVSNKSSISRLLPPTNKYWKCNIPSFSIFGFYNVKYLKLKKILSKERNTLANSTINRYVPSQLGLFPYITSNFRNYKVSGWQNNNIILPEYVIYGEHCSSYMLNTKLNPTWPRFILEWNGGGKHELRLLPARCRVST